MNDSQIATNQAIALALHALDGNQQAYIEQMHAIEKPYLVLDRMCELFLESVPEPRQDLYARALRDQLITQLI